MNTIESYIKNQIRKVLNEMAVIKPFDFDIYLEKLKSQEGQILSLDSINKIFEGSMVYFSGFDEFYNSLTTDAERMVAPKDLMLMGGVKFALFNRYLDKIQVVIEPDLFFEYINTQQEDKEEFYGFLRLIFRHESIHVQQVEKGTNYKLDASPTANAKKYWASQHEIMAYAQSLVDDLLNNGHTQEEIMNLLKHEKKIQSWIHNVYKKVLDEKQYKKFMKYVYMYLLEN
jgi:hypothetical protein